VAEKDNKKKTSKDSVLELADKYQKGSTQMIYGTDPEFEKENKEANDKIKSVISKVGRTYKQTTGDNVLEFFTRFNFEEDKENKFNTLVSNSQDNKKTLNINKLIEDDTGLVNDIFYSESDRLTFYRNYEMVYDLIPQMSKALDTIVDNVMSPDDFTKNMFNIFFDGVSINSSFDADDIGTTAAKNIRDLDSKYDIEGKAQEIIRNVLKKGDQFIAVLKLEKEINKILDDPTSAFKKEDSSIDYKLNGGLVELEDLDSLRESEMYAGLFQDYDEKIKILENKVKKIDKEEDKKNLNDKERKALENKLIESLSIRIAECVNNNIEFTGDNNSLILSEATMIQEDFKREAERKKVKNNKAGGSKKDEKSTDFQLPGSVIKILDPERVVKLESDGVCYGYYYVEKADDENFGKEPIRDRQSSVGLGMVQMATGGGIDMTKNIKAEVINNIFVKNIAKKIDKNFIMQNKDFKYLIYNLLKQGYIIEKKIKISYLGPDEVVHFYVNKYKEYGNGIFRNILFAAKLYLATLTSTFMAKLTRAPEHRIFYIEVGLDEDAEGAVQEFVRNIKNKEIKMNDLTDINTVLSNAGQFQDIYIPVMRGEKPVEIDTLPGMDVDINNDFLEYLLKAMISGIGIPSSFLGLSDEVEFMRSLAMQNGQFVRMVVNLQKVFGEFFSDLYRKVYRNEYGEEKDVTDFGYRKDDNKNKIDPNDTYSQIGVKPTSTSGADLTSRRKLEESLTLDLFEGMVDPLILEGILPDTTPIKKGSPNFPEPGGVAANVNKDQVIYTKIEVRFPPPSSLNMAALLDQINNAKDIIEFVVTVEMGDDAEENSKKYLRKEVAKTLVPGLDWTLFDDLKSKAEIAIAKAKAEKASTAKTTADDSASTDDTSTDGY
jgi:hypothetical protein